MSFLLCSLYAPYNSVFHHSDWWKKRKWKTLSSLPGWFQQSLHSDSWCVNKWNYDRWFMIHTLCTILNTGKRLRVVQHGWTITLSLKWLDMIWNEANSFKSLCLCFYVCLTILSCGSLVMRVRFDAENEYQVSLSKPSLASHLL